MKRLLTALVIGTLALTACGTGASAERPAPFAASAPQVVAGNKVVPWGLAFLPDGSALFTERVTRSIWAVAPGHAARRIYTVNEAVSNGEGGLLGLAVAPTYSRNLRVYLYYSTGSDNRIAFIRRGSPARPTPIVTGIPAGSNHNGGGPVFGPARFLQTGTRDDR